MESRQRNIGPKPVSARVAGRRRGWLLELIKGRGVRGAGERAAFTKKRIAPVIHKLLDFWRWTTRSTFGEQGADVDVDNLYVKTALARRWTAHEAHRQTSHGDAAFHR